MAKTVSDVAIMLGALEGASPDPNDPATRTCTPPPGRDYTKFLKRDGLKGARIGIPRAFFYDARDAARRQERARRTERRAEQGDGRGDRRAEAQGAIIVDPADIPSIVDKDPKQQLPDVGHCSGVEQRQGARMRTAPSCSSTA